MRAGSWPYHVRGGVTFPRPWADYVSDYGTATADQQMLAASGSAVGVTWPTTRVDQAKNSGQASQQCLTPEQTWRISFDARKMFRVNLAEFLL